MVYFPIWSTDAMDSINRVSESTMGSLTPAVDLSVSGDREHVVCNRIKEPNAFVVGYNYTLWDYKNYTVGRFFALVLHWPDSQLA